MKCSWFPTSRLVFAAAFFLALFNSPVAHGFISTYTGQLTALGSDPRGLSGATFSFTVTFPEPATLDFTFSDGLTATSQSLSISNASVPTTNGVYTIPALRLFSAPTNRAIFTSGGSASFSAVGSSFTMIAVYGRAVQAPLSGLSGQTALLGHFPTGG